MAIEITYGERERLRELAKREYQERLAAIDWIRENANTVVSDEPPTHPEESCVSSECKAHGTTEPLAHLRTD